MNLLNWSSQKIFASYLWSSPLQPPEYLLHWRCWLGLILILIADRLLLGFKIPFVNDTIHHLSVSPAIFVLMIIHIRYPARVRTHIIHIACHTQHCTDVLSVFNIMVVIDTLTRSTTSSRQQHTAFFTMCCCHEPLVQCIPIVANDTYSLPCIDTWPLPSSRCLIASTAVFTIILCFLFFVSRHLVNIIMERSHLNFPNNSSIQNLNLPFMGLWLRNTASSFIRSWCCSFSITVIPRQLAHLFKWCPRATELSNTFPQ